MGDNGMDGGLWGIKAFGGGRFQFEICQQQECCQTKNLNTEDDNWEKYEVNYFVGKQLKGCENFNVTNDSNLVMGRNPGNTRPPARRIEFWPTRM